MAGFRFHLKKDFITNAIFVGVKNSFTKKRANNKDNNTKDRLSPT